VKFLLCVGAEKAGTTWLYQYFSFHPDFHTLGKELNIIQRDDLVPVLENVDSFRKNINEYFQSASAISKVTGDFTHYEGSSENIFRLIKDGFSKVNIDVVPVYIMRDPIKRAVSAWNMLGGGSCEMAKPVQFVMTNFLSCKYKETVQALDNVFDKPLYFFYENFFQQENIDTITDMLEMSRHDAMLSMKVNQGSNMQVSPEFIELFGKSEKNRNAVAFIKERFPDAPWDFEDYT
jgi:hypothetical protein